MNFKKLAITVAIIMVASLIPFGGTASATSTLMVDDDGVQCPGAYTSIQVAVTAAVSGDTIIVCPGTYVEQVTIPAGKDGLTISSQGNQDAIIKAPIVMVDVKAIVRVNGATNVTISGFTITGPGGGGCDSIRYGVRVDSSGSATIRGNHITMIHDTPFSGCQNGNAIQVGRWFEGQTGTATIRDNLINHYQKTGIVVDNVGSYADIENNTIIGVGPTLAIAQNGIQVSRGASAEVKHNDVSGNVYTPESDASTGILLYQAGALDVSHNRVSASEVGIYLFDVDDASVSHNRSDNNTYDGIYADPDSSGNTISYNRMEDNGVYDAEDESHGGGTGGTANFWEQNNCTTDNPDGLCGH